MLQGLNQCYWAEDGDQLFRQSICNILQKDHSENFYAELGLSRFF